MRFCEAPEGCKYPVFSTDKITRKGYCRTHATRYRTDLDRRSIIQKAMSKQKSLSTKIRGLQDTPANKEILIEKGYSQDLNLELFFKLAAIEISKCPWCIECNTFIGLSQRNDDVEVYKSKITIEQVYRNATAHIFPKAIFDSVRAHPKNYLPLPASCGCHNKTHRWDTFSKMKCWDIAVSHIKEIYPFIDDIEKKNIPYEVWKEIPDEYEKYYGHPLPPNSERMTSYSIDS